MTFDAELRELLSHGYVLVGRVGYFDRHSLRARADRAVERLDHEDWVQVVASRDAHDVIVRIEQPDSPSPRVVVLACDPSLAPTIQVQAGELYLGGTYRVVERIDDPERAEARWQASELAACWVDTPAPYCC